MLDIQAWLAKAGYSVVDNGFRALIDTWKAWYDGYDESFHKYSIYNGVQMVGMTKRALHMAKFVCEDWANLLLNERVKITCASAMQERLDGILRANHFAERANRLIEHAFALGTGAFVEFLGDDGVPFVDYVTADHIYPLAWRGDEITACAFASITVRDGKKAAYIQIHKPEGGVYVIYNHLMDYETGDVLPLPDGVSPRADTGSGRPLYQIIRPNIANALVEYPDTPMGFSVFAHSIDVLKSLDDTYDSLANEYKLGRKRIILPTSMTKIKMANAIDDQGTPVFQPMFDPRDAVFYAIEGEEKKPIEIDMNLRIDAHEAGIRLNLNLLSKKCGLGADRFSFDKGGGVKTATEVISDKSDLYQNLRKHELTLERALVDMINALATLTGYKGDTEASITFDDSIIEDKQQKLQDAVLLLSNGLISKETVLTKVMGMNTQDAQQELERIRTEGGVSSDAVDDFTFGGEA